MNTDSCFVFSLIYCYLYVLFIIMSNELACFEVALALVIQASVVIFLCFLFVCDKLTKIYVTLSLLLCIKLQLKSQLSVVICNIRQTHTSGI